MKQALYQYCLELTPLEVFGTQHQKTLVISLALVICVPWLAHRYFSEIGKQRLGSFIGWVTFSGYALWGIMHFVAGTFDIGRHLPLHLCYVVGVVTPLAMTWRNHTAFEFVYYCGCSGVLQACISPADVGSYPHFDFFRFWMLHTGVILSAVYAVVVYRMQPTAKGVHRTWLIVLAYLGLAICVNLALSTNYFYICVKPPQSLLDYLGPWPWYVLVAIPLAYVLIGVGYVPVWIHRRFRNGGSREKRCRDRQA